PLVLRLGPGRPPRASVLGRYGGERETGAKPLPFSLSVPTAMGKCRSPPIGKCLTTSARRSSSRLWLTSLGPQRSSVPSHAPSVGDARGAHPRELSVMCGRIGASMPRAELLETYFWLRDAPEDEPRYNIAPTDPLLAVGPDRAEAVRWGVEGSKGGLFNLRSESALGKPYYRDMLLGQRVLVPASHFYEWRRA